MLNSVQHLIIHEIYQTVILKRVQDDVKATFLFEFFLRDLRIKLRC